MAFDHQNISIFLLVKPAHTIQLIHLCTYGIKNFTAWIFTLLNSNDSNDTSMSI